LGPEIKSTLKSASSGAVGGAVATIIIGFAWGGWTTSSTTQEMTEEALLASRAAICVAQFTNDPNNKEKLNEFKSSDHPLRELTNYELGKAIEKIGWDKMPGQQDAVWNVSRACADGIELLMEK
jgi:hypothetical protein